MPDGSAVTMNRGRSGLYGAMLAVSLAVGTASLSPAPARGGEMPGLVGVWVTSTAACFATKTSRADRWARRASRSSA